MIKLFRKIRHNLVSEGKTKRYLKYALGEIVLVVIGILIALSINNWNEHRKNILEETVILNNLIEDLKADIKGYNESIAWLESRKAHVNSLLMFLKNPNLPINDAELIHWLITSGYILDYTPVFPTYAEITGAGKLTLIESEKIKKDLSHYKSNFDNDVRVFTSYDEGIKKIEFKALSIISGSPKGQFFGDDYLSLNKGLTVNRERLLKDEELLALLKHNAYHTQVEINLKSLEYIPMADSLIEIIKNELIRLK